MMYKLEWHSENVIKYYCAELNREIARGRIYYLSCNGNKGYIICDDWAEQKNAIISFGIFEKTALALRNEGSYFSSQKSIYDIYTGEQIGSIDNSIILKRKRYNTNAKMDSIFRKNFGCDMKFEVYAVYNDITLTIDIDRNEKKWYNNLLTTALNGTVMLADNADWDLIFCSFFCLHNYFLNR